MPRRDQTERLGTGSDFAERHRPRRTSKTRRPDDSSVNPLQRGVAPARRKTPKQQRLPYDGVTTSNVTTRRRALTRYIPEGFGPRLAKVGAALLFIALLFGGLIFALYLFGGSRFFALRQVELEGNNRVSDDDIRKMIDRVTAEGVWRAKLKDVRDELKKNELIEDAEVTRVLPDKLHVVVKEREPFALARRGESVVCVDRSGMMFGDATLLKGQNVPPVVSGLIDSGENIIEENRKRLMSYQQLLGDLDSTVPKLSPRIDEVIFDDELNISLILKDSRIVVRIGKEDFRTRLNAALDVLDAIRRKDAQALQVLKIEDAERLLSSSNRVAYLNATIPKRVIVGLAE
ncbi:MAG TPA: FtsQ-type POTRA domain-containing protein [Blastocatellia bacterium]|nr:FtsQ-type POTRA domain-containing protein [Blastocatellia bacterium]